MQTLILPGYSSKNKEWVDEVAKNLKVKGTVRPFHWAHWNDENSKFNAKEKAELIAKHIKGDNINIIAKSIGTLVVSYLYKIIPDQIKKVVFCGIPVNDFDAEDIKTIKSFLESHKGKTLILQNLNDPHGSYDKVSKLGDVKMTNRDDHEYPFIDKFNEFIVG